MYALVEIQGQQFKVETGKEIFVHRLKGKEGDKMDFTDVFLIDDSNGNVLLGTPKVTDAKVTASIQSHVKGDKVIVFKKKRRKGYKVRNGHRQFFTKIKIEGIVAKGIKEVKAAVKKEVKPAVTKAKVAPSTKQPAAIKTAKSTAVKKPVKKTTVKKKTENIKKPE